jgi:hypothetical protein
MNRSILIVVCDFLLVSLLAFSSIDANKLQDMGKRSSAVTPSVPEPVTNQPAVGPGRDLANVMRQALDEERKSRDLLLSELSKARETLGEKENLLKVREGQALALQRELEHKEDLAKRLETEQDRLRHQYSASQTNIQALTRQVQESTVQNAVSRERLAAMEADLKRQVEQAATLQGRMATLEQSNQAVLGEKQQLSTKLQVAEAQKEIAAKQVEQMQEQVRVEREERAKLAEGVKQLATRSADLTQEIRENRPLAANTIFHDILTNRVHARINAFRSGVLGIDSNKRKATETVVIADGTNNYALCHVDDTPLVLANPGTDWESLTGTLLGNAGEVPISQLSFFRRDPRVILIPVTSEEVKKLAVKVYQRASDPFKFQDAVLIGATEGYYGECRFQIDISTPDYVKLDSNFVKGLFGKFNPSRGDLVLSRNGELLGIMANNTYCLRLQNFDLAATFQFSPDVRNQSTGRTLAQLQSILLQLPPRLQ